ncbi:MAG: PD-(D/E)XK nuclease family protein [Desulfurococcales archaeon]|nr:PD-(D/E)XK nuclease family protein [Desulfurococcales archaeon]
MSRRKVFPSDVRKVGYCPTMYFFDLYLREKAPLSLRVRAVWGKLLHLFHRLVRLSWINEALIKAELGDLQVTLVGRPDSFRVVEESGKVVVEEFKSHKAPSRESSLTFHGAWLSDALQTMTYALMLRTAGKGTDFELIVRYIDKSVKIPYDEELVLKYIRLLKDIAEGVFPEPGWVSRNKCRRCPYREICPYSPYRKVELRGFYSGEGEGGTPQPS